MTKSELRQMFSERRNRLSPDEHAEKSRQIAELFFASTDLSKTGSIHCFLPLGHRKEVDTSLIIHELWSRHPDVRVIVPRINFESGELENLAYAADTELVENPWGVPEPQGGVLTDPEAIDIVIVPLVCFDLRGYRVGYGKGFYDRFLAACRADCLKIGVSFFPPVEHIDDIHPGDIPLDRCITPKIVYRRDTHAAGMMEEKVPSNT